MAFLEKNPLKHALFTLQHYSSSRQQKSAFRRKQNTGLKIFQKQPFFVISDEKENSQNTVSAKKSEKRTMFADSLGKL